MKTVRLILIILSICNLNKTHAQGTWSALHNGLTCDLVHACNVYSLCADTVNNVLYAGGSFKYADSIPQRGIAKWDGTKWDTIPNVGFTDAGALIMYKGNLCVGDAYTDEIWLFNGTSWSYLPAFNGGVTCLGIYKDTLYAGGDFTKSDTTTLNYIAKWDGNKWQPLKTGITGSFLQVNTMAVYHDTLFVGGYFSMVDTVPAYSIAKWDGANWSAVGDNGVTFWSGTGHRSPAYVNALGVFKNNLYIGGCFDSVGGMPASTSVGMWKGNIWDTIPHPNFESLRECDSYGALKSFDGYLFMYGGTEWVSKWDGISVTAVDSAPNNQISSFAVWNGSLYVGGIFDTVGKTILANGIARWTPDSISTGGKTITINCDRVSVYPNPTSGETTVTSSRDIQGIKVTDLLGQLIYEAQPKQLKFTLDLKETGMYFVTVTSGDVIETKKVVVVR